MARLHVGEHVQNRLVGTATSTAAGAYTVRMSHPAAITSSVYNGYVNLMIMAAGHDYASLYGLPLKVTAGGTIPRLTPMYGKATAVPARARLHLYRLSRSGQVPTAATTAAADAAATSGCIILTQDLGPRWDRIDGLWSTIAGVRKNLSYTQGSTSTIGIGINVDGGGWVTGQAGTTSVTGGSSTVTFPEETGYTSVYDQSEFELGIFQDCTISPELEVFPYAWDGGALPATSSGNPQATYCVYEASGTTQSVNRNEAFNFQDGIGLVDTFGINLSSVTGYSSSTTLSYTYTRSRYMCGTHNYPARSFPGGIVADATSSGNS